MFTKLTTAVAVLLGYASAGERFYIDQATQTLRTPEGRHTIFHGVNAVYKVAPYIPITDEYDSQDSMTDVDIQNLYDWGFNFVRLGVMWEAVERSPGVYDSAYLDKVDALITKLGKKGIYTMVDAHQDIFARKICGEGIPNFYAKQIIDNGTYCLDKKFDFLLEPVVKKFGMCKSMKDYDLRYDEDGNPLIEDCQKYNFAAIYTSPEALTIQRAFYYNDLGLKDKFVSFWKVMATRFANNKYVVAYDPLNEPAPSAKDLGGFIANLWPGNLDSSKIAPLYTDINKAYSKIDEGSIMAFEPTPLPPDALFNMGFKTPPGGEVNSAHHIMNEHTYCCGPLTSICNVPSTNSLEIGFWKTFCNYFIEYKLMRMGQDAAKLQIPLLVSEFGACTDVDPCVTEITQVTENTDAVLGSWAYWQFKTFHDLTTTAQTTSEGFYNQDGSLQENKLKALVRTYVQYAQGETQRMEFKDGVFSADIKVDTSLTAPTQVFAQLDATKSYCWYPHGYDMEISSKGSVKPTYTKSVSGNRISIAVTNAEFNGQVFTVKITPKAK